jgi:hypothetical protein
MVKFKERPVKDNIANLNYSSGATVSIALPRDRWLQKVMLRILVVVGTAAGTPHQDGIANLVRNVTLESNEEVYYNCRAWDIVEYNRKMYRKTPKNDSPTAGTKVVAISLDLMRNPSDLNDISALVNTKALSSLNLKITWGTDADLGSGSAGAVTSGSVTVQLREADLTPEEIQRQGSFYTVKHSIQEQSYTATSSEFTKSLNLPIGHIIDYVGVKTIDASSPPVRTNTIISSYQLISKDTDKIVECEWNESIEEDERDYEQEASVTGYTALDLRSNFGGYDARGQKDGDIKYHFNIAVVGTLRLFQKEAY